MNEDIECPVCDRSTPHKFQEKHHLVPKSKKGKETVIVCCDCGDMIHKIFSLKELEKEYNSIDAIGSDERIVKWVSWVQKKPNRFGICMKRKKPRSGKRRSR